MFKHLQGNWGPTAKMDMLIIAWLLLHGWIYSGTFLHRHLPLILPPHIPLPHHLCLFPCPSPSLSPFYPLPLPLSPSLLPPPGYQDCCVSWMTPASVTRARRVLTVTPTRSTGTTCARVPRATWAPPATGTWMSVP